MLAFISNDHLGHVRDSACGSLSDRQLSSVVELAFLRRIRMCMDRSVSVYSVDDCCTMCPGFGDALLLG